MTTDHERPKRRRVELGPTGNTVRENLARFRKLRSLSLRELSSRMTDIGRVLSPNALSDIEMGGRRVDVDDLMALSIALNVHPASFLTPDSATKSELFAVTGARNPVRADHVYEWLHAGSSPVAGDIVEYLEGTWRPRWFRESKHARLLREYHDLQDKLYDEKDPAVRADLEAQLQRLHDGPDWWTDGDD
nr:helix-turn-helix transcriptional regulator [Smaragdicoccus niigatensis]